VGADRLVALDSRLESRCLYSSATAGDRATSVGARGRFGAARFAADVLLRLSGWKPRVDACEAHRFLVDLLETGECYLQHSAPWIRASLQRLEMNR